MNYYDSIAKGYNKLYKDEQLKKFENVKHLIKGKVLDLGCGTGFITSKLKDAVGIDSSFGMAKLCPKKVEALVASCERLPFKDESFDTVFSLTVLQDVSDIKSSVSEIRRVLKKDGNIVLSVLNKRKIDEVRKELKKNFGKMIEKENYNDVVFFTQ